MKKKYIYPTKTRLLWGAAFALVPCLYWNWLFFAGLTDSGLIVALVIGLGLTGFGSYGLAHLFESFILTEQTLIYGQVWRTRTIPYEEIFYARRNPSLLTRLTLITKQGNIHIPQGIAQFEALFATLETHLPNLLTPHVPLPWQVSRSRDAVAVNIVFSLFFVGLNIPLIILIFVERVYAVSLLVLLFFGLAGIFVYDLLTKPQQYYFTPERIDVHSFNRQETFEAAAIKAVYRDHTIVRTKNGQRTIHQAVVRFGQDRTLTISQDDIGYPFDEFYTILAYYYTPDELIGLPWSRQAAHIPHHSFAKGSLNKFRWYLEGNSQVVVSSLEDVCHWLKTCQYAQDEVLFNQSDHWQHPSQFEQTRQGDCEDHALWAWRKLGELGIPPNLWLVI